MVEIIGADYSFSKPGGAALKRAGVKAVGRYLGGTNKGLWNPEIRDLKANGIAIWLVYEPGDPGQMGKGYGQGVADARAAQAILNGLELPATLPIYSACDFDAVGAGKLGAVMDYQRGWTEVLGIERSGIYGGGDVLAQAKAQGLAIYFWQAAGWAGRSSTIQVESEGGTRRRWAGTTIYQVYGNVMVDGTDKCIIYSVDYGQLPAGSTFDDEDDSAAKAAELARQNEIANSLLTRSKGMIILGDQTGDKYPYYLDFVDGKRRALSHQEYSIAVTGGLSNGHGIVIMNQASFDGIPKKEGSV